VFLKGSFLEKLIENIAHLSIHEYQPNEQRYKDAAQQIRVCSKQETNEVEKLVDPIVDCLSSKHYFNVYKKIDINQVKVAKSNLAAKQLFFMRDCSEFLVRHDYKRQEEVASSLCKKMLEIAETIFEQYLPVIIGTEGQTNIV
jgi:tRNA G26 N,N-dimethylase Trm1